MKNYRPASKTRFEKAAVLNHRQIVAREFQTKSFPGILKFSDRRFLKKKNYTKLGKAIKSVAIEGRRIAYFDSKNI